MPALDKGANALYAQLIARIRERIMDGAYPLGSQIPTELELSAKYQVSRGTVRQAMTALVNEGLLERIRGRGTFVRAFPSSRRYTSTSPAEKRIGVILSHSSDELDLMALIGIENAARARGYQVSFVCTEENMEQQAQDIAHLRADRVSGMIIFPIRDIEYDESIWRLRAEGVPFVLVDRYFPTLDADYVTSDNLNGGFRATEHLIILGHRRIGFLYSYLGTLTTTSVRDRWLGYRNALQEYGLPYDETLVYRQPFPSDSADPFRDFLLRPDRPSAVFAAADYVALAFMQSVQRNGLRVPDDLALVGFDNSNFASRLSPALTTVAQKFSDMGSRAAELLMNRIEGLAGPPLHIELPAHLIIRESCGARLRIRTGTAAKQ